MIMVKKFIHHHSHQNSFTQYHLSHSTFTFIVNLVNYSDYFENSHYFELFIKKYHPLKSTIHHQNLKKFILIITIFIIKEVVIHTFK